MDPNTARLRVESARVGRLATVTEAGRPHLVPCCFALDGDMLYTPVDAKPKSTTALRRLANLAANPAASLLVDHYEEDWSALWWVRIDGHGRILERDRDQEHERALGHLAAKYEQYRRTRPPGPVIAVDIRTWRSWP